MSFQFFLKVQAAMSKSEAIWQKDGDEKRAAVQQMFAKIAPNYDRLNSLMSLSLHKKWREQAVNSLCLAPGDSALDLCCGTGDFLLPLRKRVGSQGTLVGIDFCEPMLQQAKSKDSATLILGDATQIPLESATMDGVTVGWGIRNVPDIDQTHREIFRVLKPGKRFVSLDMAMPENSVVRGLSRFVGKHILPRLGARFGAEQAYTYLPESTVRFWDRQKLAESMKQAGFKDVGYRNLFFGNICLHWGTKP